jgi:DNA-binding response OmpR family regulator
VLQFIRHQSVLTSTRVLVISSDDGLRKSCEAIGIDGWMTKPVSVQAFVDHIEALLPQWS